MERTKQIEVDGTKVRRFKADRRFPHRDFDINYPILAEGSVLFDSDLEEDDFDSEGNLIVQKPSTRDQIGPKKRNRDLAEVVRQYKWILVKEKDGERIEEISPVWFWNSDCCISDVNYRKMWLENEEINVNGFITTDEREARIKEKGLTITFKVIRRLAPFETEKALAEKVYAYLLLHHFNFILRRLESERPRIRKADPVAEREQLAREHADECHRLISVHHFVHACFELANRVVPDPRSYVRFAVARQVRKEADLLRVLLKEEHSFEYEYKFIV